MRCRCSVEGATFSQRAPAARQAVGCALARIGKRASRAGLVAARVTRQAMVNAGFDDQRVELGEEEGAAAVRLDCPVHMEVLSNGDRNLGQERDQRVLDQALDCIIRRTQEVEPRRQIEARKQASRIRIHHK